MDFNQELIDLLLGNELITSVWTNEDATEWHTHSVDGLIEVQREEILGAEKKPITKTVKNGSK